MSRSMRAGVVGPELAIVLLALASGLRVAWQDGMASGFTIRRLRSASLMRSRRAAVWLEATLAPAPPFALSWLSIFWMGAGQSQAAAEHFAQAAARSGSQPIAHGDEIPSEEPPSSQTDAARSDDVARDPIARHMAASDEDFEAKQPATTASSETSSFTQSHDAASLATGGSGPRASGPRKTSFFSWRPIGASGKSTRKQGKHQDPKRVFYGVDNLSLHCALGQPDQVNPAACRVSAG